jgi:hypothetical protein
LLEEFDLLLDCLRGRVRVGRNQDMEPSAGIIDSQSVKWGNNRSLNGIDGKNKGKAEDEIVYHFKPLLIAYFASPSTQILCRFQAHGSYIARTSIQPTA